MSNPFGDINPIISPTSPETQAHIRQLYLDHMRRRLLSDKPVLYTEDAVKRLVERMGSRSMLARAAGVSLDTITNLAVGRTPRSSKTTLNALAEVARAKGLTYVANYLAEQAMHSQFETYAKGGKL